MGQQGQNTDFPVNEAYVKIRTCMRAGKEHELGED